MSKIYFMNRITDGAEDDDVPIGGKVAPLDLTVKKTEPKSVKAEPKSVKAEPTGRELRQNARSVEREKFQLGLQGQSPEVIKASLSVFDKKSDKGGRPPTGDSNKNRLGIYGRRTGPREAGVKMKISPRSNAYFDVNSLKTPEKQKQQWGSISKSHGSKNPMTSLDTKLGK